MSANAITKQTNAFPSLFDDFFKPWNDWFDKGNGLRRLASVPAVNVTEDETRYVITMAAPGLEKKDFHIDADGNMLTISVEKEEEKESKRGQYTRQEYNFSSFSRTFTLPEDVNRDAIDARYENGELRLVLPRKEEAKKSVRAKQIAIN